MTYTDINSAERMADALCLGEPVNRKRDGGRSANLSVANGAPGGLGGGLGLMNIAAERESVKGAVRVAYSYLTPIAWELPGGRWIVSVQHHSAPTLRHQRTMAQAIKYMGNGSPRTLDGRDGVVVLNMAPGAWHLPAAA